MSVITVALGVPGDIASSERSSLLLSIHRAHTRSGGEQLWLATTPDERFPHEEPTSF